MTTAFSVNGTATAMTRRSPVMIAKLILTLSGGDMLRRSLASACLKSSEVPACHQVS